MTFNPHWQAAEMHPAWSRWLPCSIHLLRVVPDPYRFPRKALDDLPEEFAWDEPAWCDPGDPDELIAAAVADNDGGDEQWAAAHAREHYDERVKLRANRIDAFTNMCRRAGVAPPATLAQLLECLIGLGLYHGETVDGEEWLLPRLWQNPIDVLPLGFEELAEEISNQFHERALLAGAGLRRLVLADTTPDPDADSLAVTPTLRHIGDHAGIPAGQVAPALALLASEEMIDLSGVDLDRLGLDSPFDVILPWTRYEPFFDFDVLPPPEHFH